MYIDKLYKSRGVCRYITTVVSTIDLIGLAGSGQQNHSVSLIKQLKVASSREHNSLIKFRLIRSI